MRLKHLMAALMLSIGTDTAVMAAGSVEQAIESTTEMVTLPEKLPGTVLIRSCAQCAPIAWSTPANARLVIGKEAISLTKLRQFVIGKRYNMVVFYDSGTKLITRIQVTGVTLTN